MKTKLFNIEAEQIILGSIILNNDYLYKVNEILKAEHFYEPVHQTIYEYLASQTSCDKITLKKYFENNELTKQIGGVNYLAIILNLATGIFDIVSYAKIVLDMYLKRRCFSMAGELMEVVNDPEKTSIEILQNIRTEIETLQDTTGFEYNLKTLQETIKDGLEQIECAVAGTYKSRLKTGIVNFDEYFGGLANDELIILAGRPSMGKSAIAYQIALNVCPVQNVVFFSEEMSNHINALRTLTNFTDIDLWKFEHGKLTDAELDEAKRIYDVVKNANLFIDDNSKITPSYMEKTLRRFYRKHKKIGLIIIDYLQFTGTDLKTNDPKIILQDTAKKLKGFAKQYNCPVFCLSQLNRLVESRENKRPELSDIRDSGTIEQDADMIIFCYRSEYYLQHELNALLPGDKNFDIKQKKLEERIALSKNVCELIVKKNRNGACGTVKIKFYPSRFKCY